MRNPDSSGSGWKVLVWSYTPSIVAYRRTGGRGVDHVVEVGGAGTLAQSLRAVRMGGTVSVIGVLSGRAGELDLAPVLMRKLKLQGVLVGIALVWLTGWDRLDREILRVARRVKRLDPLPQGFRGSVAVVRIPINFRIQQED